jgi:serine/threonine protein kinase
MRHSNLYLHLDQMATITSLVCYPLEGVTFGESSFKFHTAYALPGVNYTYTHQNQTYSEPLQIVVSKPKSSCYSAITPKTAAAVAAQALTAKFVPDDFNHAYFYRSINGETISQYLPEKDFYEFTLKYQFSSSDLVNFIGQMLMAVKRFHDVSLAHRDIKWENFFAYCRNQKIFLKLGDHDDVIEVDSLTGTALHSTLFPSGTEANVAPEIHSVLVALAKPDTLTLELVHLNKEINWLAADCYAMGKCISRMLDIYYIHKILPLQFGNDISQENAILSKIVNLTQRLMDSNMSDRYTISQAMACDLFGESPAQCIEFFLRLEEEAQFSIAFDNITFESIKIRHEDAYFLLPRDLKKIYDIAHKIYEEIENCFFSIDIVNPTYDELCDRTEFFQSACELHEELNQLTTYLNTTEQTEDCMQSLFNFKTLYEQETAYLTEVFLRLMQPSILNMLDETINKYQPTYQIALFKPVCHDKVVSFRNKFLAKQINELKNQIIQAVNGNEAITILLQYTKDRATSDFKQTIYDNLVKISPIDPSAYELEVEPNYENAGNALKRKFSY